MTPIRKPDDDDAFMRKFSLPEEDRRTRSNWPQWCGGHRWFRSANVIDLQNYRSPAEKKRIKVVLLFQDERWC